MRRIEDKQKEDSKIIKTKNRRKRAKIDKRINE